MQQLEVRRLLTTIYYESFESGLGVEWTLTEVHADADVRIRDLAAEGIITNPASLQFTENGNNHALVLTSSNASGDDVDDLGIATVSVDLTGYDDAVLTFHQFELDDENLSLPDQHSTFSVGDGLAVSNDGVNWYTLTNLEGRDINRGGDGRWQLHEYDLGLEFARINSSFSAGLSFDRDIQFKFSQYDNTPLPNDGWAIDEFLIVDQSRTFDASLPRGAFHRFNLSSEDDNDYYYRAAVYGTPDASTPIVTLIHGSNGDTDYDGYAWRWHNYVTDPANGIDSIILVMPAFVEDVQPGRFNTPERYPFLSWNTDDNAAADLALLDTVDAITASGFGNGTGIFMWGFSAGGQFIGRFTAAHPDRVAAAVVGGPASQILPDEDVSFGFGSGPSGSRPAPAGVKIDTEDFASSRIMYWVGQDDADPNHPDLTRGPTIDALQGLTRRERAANQFEVMHKTAEEFQLSPNDFEYELLISEGDGHGWGSSDIPEIAEFLFRAHDPARQPIRLHPRVVRIPSAHSQLEFLPQSVPQLATDETFYVELWLEAPPSTTVRSGVVDLFFDTTLANAVSFEHGVFAASATGVIDEASGRLRDFGGRSSGAAAPGTYQLFGRIEMQTDGSALDDTARLIMALQRNQAAEFVLSTGASQRTDLQPFESVYLGGIAQGVTSGRIQGAVFDDHNNTQTRQADERGLEGRFVHLTNRSTGLPVITEFTVEPDAAIGHGSYLTDANPWVRLSAIGSEPIHGGVRAFNKGNDESSTGDYVFAFDRDDGRNTQWVEGLRSLRMDFVAPTSEVSLDVIAKLGDARDLGRLEVYSSDGTLLEQLTTSDLADGAFETATITRPQADIAYAIAAGVGSNRIRLDNLRFRSLVRRQTDPNGHYRFDEIPAGDYSVVSSVEADLPVAVGNRIDVNVQPGVLKAAVNVPVFEQPLIADLKATYFNVVSDHLEAAAQTSVSFTIVNVGNEAAGSFQIHVMHSLDAVIGNADDRLIETSEHSIAGLAAGATVSRTVSLQLDAARLYGHAVASTPAGTSAGTKSGETAILWLNVDANHDVTESDESNNLDVGHLIDRDDITYFPWDTNRNGVITPQEAIAAIRMINTPDHTHDFDGNGVVSPLEALAVLQRIGYLRNEDVIETGLTSVVLPDNPLPVSQPTDIRIARVANALGEDQAAPDLFAVLDVLTAGPPLLATTADSSVVAGGSPVEKPDWLKVIDSEKNAAIRG